MTRGETLLWMIALDYASSESFDAVEAEELKVWWREVVSGYTVTAAAEVGNWS